jgi:hypothetical protein
MRYITQTYERDLRTEVGLYGCIVRYIRRTIAVCHQW